MYVDKKKRKIKSVIIPIGINILMYLYPKYFCVYLGT